MDGLEVQQAGADCLQASPGEGEIRELCDYPQGEQNRLTGSWEMSFTLLEAQVLTAWWRKLYDRDRRMK